MMNNVGPFLNKKNNVHTITCLVLKHMYMRN